MSNLVVFILFSLLKTLGGAVLMVLVLFLYFIPVLYMMFCFKWAIIIKIKPQNSTNGTTLTKLLSNVTDIGLFVYS